MKNAIMLHNLENDFVNFLNRNMLEADSHPLYPQLFKEIRETDPTDALAVAQTGYMVATLIKDDNKARFWRMMGKCAIDLQAYKAAQAFGLNADITFTELNED